MKVFIFTLSMMFGAVFSSVAQAPIITAADMYAFGDLNVQYYADTAGLTIGKSGANVTWDFSKLKQISTKDSTVSRLITVASSPYGNDFPNADFATASLSGKNYVYATFKNNTVSIIGAEGEQTSNGQTVIIKQIYDVPQVMYAYPLTYNTNQNNPYAAHYDAQGTMAYRKGSVSVVGDGYGTLKIMNKTYANVLRMHSITSETDSFDGIPFTLDFSVESYVWVTPGKKDAILTMTNISKNGNPGTVYYNTNSKTLGIDEIGRADNSIEIYPNPARNYCRVVFAGASASTADIEIVNQMGQTVKTIQGQMVLPGRNTMNIDLSAFSKGLYFVKLTTPSGIQTKKLILD